MHITSTHHLHRPGTSPSITCGTALLECTAPVPRPPSITSLPPFLHWTAAAPPLDHLPAELNIDSHVGEISSARGWREAGAGLHRVWMEGQGQGADDPAQLLRRQKRGVYWGVG